MKKTKKNKLISTKHIRSRIFWKQFIVVLEVELKRNFDLKIHISKVLTVSAGIEPLINSCNKTVFHFHCGGGDCWATYQQAVSSCQELQESESMVAELYLTLNQNQYSLMNNPKEDDPWGHSNLSNTIKKLLSSKTEALVCSLLSP